MHIVTPLGLLEFLVEIVGSVVGSEVIEHSLGKRGFIRKNLPTDYQT